MPQEIYVIDHFALAFRSFYAFINNPLSNSKGEETSVLFGYANTLFRLIAEKGAHNVVIAKDLSGPNFRHELYSDYKANRSAMPEEMAQQLPALDEFIKLTGIKELSVKGYEADDVMASIAAQVGKEHTIYLFTKDKDMMQMVNNNVFLFHLEKNGVPDTIVDEAHVFNKFGVPPAKIRDLLALMGDAADNVPGVPKVGPKTAAQLLEEFDDIDGIYANLAKITKKALNSNLTNNKELAYLSQKLVSLACDLDVPLDVNFYKIPPLMEDVLEAFLLEHELNGALRQFKKACQELNSNEETTPQAVIEKKVVDYKLIDDLAGLNQLKDEFHNLKYIALDTETSGLDTLSCDVAGICLAANDNKGYYLSINHKNSKNLFLNEVIEWLNELAQKENTTWFLHNAKFDLQVLNRFGFETPKNIFDTMIASYLLNPGVREHSLDAQVFKRLNHKMIPIEELIGKGKNQISFVDLTSAEAYIYSAEDAAYTYALAIALIEEIKEKGMLKPLEEIEIPLMKTLTEVETYGICIAQKNLEELSVELTGRLATLTDEIYNSAGKTFNISSPKQLGEVLFEDLKLKTGKKTKTGYSTDAAVLQNLKGEHPIIKFILEYRELEKLKNTYVDVLPNQIHPLSKRVHTSFSQTIAATGRLSSVNPNLQNIPVRTKEGQRVRESFISKGDDYVLLAADYSQIELRVLAHLSQDEALLEAYKKGMDIHTQTASMLFRCAAEEVSSEQRRQSKAVNFGILYGMSAFRLSNELDIPRYLAQEFIDSYFSGYPKVTLFIENTIKQARIDGYVETLFGHKRYLPDIDSENGNIRSGAERIAINTPIQGTAAGLIKIAMTKLHQQIKASNLDLKMLLQVHDELVFEVHKKDIDAAKIMIKSTMEQAFTMDTPLTVEIGEGDNWLKAH